MKGLKTYEKIVLGIIVLIMLVAVLVNLFILKNWDFFKFTISSCLTILVTLFVSYWLTNSNQNEKNQKEIFLHLMEKTQELVNEESMYKINANSDINVILMQKRKMNNNVTIMKKYAEKMLISDEIRFIDEKFQEYANIIGNHQDDLEYLEKSDKDLRRLLELIDWKLQEAMLKLFD